MGQRTWLGPIGRLASVLVITAACGNNPGTFINQGVLVPSAPATQPPAMLNPPPFQIIPSIGALCPVTPPFTTTMNVIVGPVPQTVSVNSMAFSFSDAAGASSQFTLPPSGLIGIFGSTTIVAGTTRTFTVHPQFGCGSGVPQLVNVQIFFLDTGGRPSTTILTAPLSLAPVDRTPR